MSLAKKNFNDFDRCVQYSQTPNNAQGLYPNAIVSIVGNRFIAVAINSCDSGYSEDYALNGNYWVNLGVEQPITASINSSNGANTGLACSTVAKYNITKTSILVNNPFNNPSYIGYDYCVSSNGGIESIPN